MSKYLDICGAANIFLSLASKLKMTTKQDSVKEQSVVNDHGIREFSIHQLTPQDLSEAKHFLTQYLKQTDPLGLASTNNRYSFEFLGIEPNTYYNDPVFKFKIKPKGSVSGKYSLEGYFQDKPTIKYKSPKQALEAIPSTSGIAYRGMSFEEYEAIMRQGFIKSRGDYNLGDAQKGYTFFAPEADMGRFYASSFSPWKLKPSHNKPGVVIGVDAKLLQTHRDKPEAIPEGELGTQNQLPIGEIKEIYFIIPVEIREGTLSLRKTPGKNGFKVVEEGISDPAIREYSILKIR